MEDYNIRKLFGEIKDIKLSQEEKTILKNNIISFARDHKNWHQYNYTNLDSCHCHCHEDKTCHKGGIFCLNNRFLVFASVALVVCLGAGVSVSAQNTLPGDNLYAFKVGINEEIKSAFIFSTEDEARWQVKRFENRLTEAEQLAAEMVVSDEVKVIIDKQLEVQSLEIQNIIKELYDNEEYEVAAGISSEFELSLRAHRSVLALLNETNTDYQFRVKPIEAKVSGLLSVATALKTQSQSKIVNIDDVNLKSLSEIDLKLANDMLLQVTSLSGLYLSDTIKARAQAHIDMASELIAKGSVDISAGKYYDARLKLRDAISVLKEAKIILEVSKDLQIDYPSDVDDGNSVEYDLRVDGDFKTIPNSSMTQISEVKVSPSPSISSEINLKANVNLLGL